jgi:hypothetical protein
MAREIKSIIKVISKTETPFGKIVGNYDPVELCKHFYNDVPTEKGTLLNSWCMDNIGSKWVEVFNVEEDELTITSGNHVPKEFLIKLFKHFDKMDNDTIVEVDFLDEVYQPIGTIVIKRFNGNISYHKEETYSYDLTQFDSDDMDEIENLQMCVIDTLIALSIECDDCIENGNGEIINEEDN